MENKAACVEEAEAASKYVVSEDMEVIDDLEEGSEGGSNDSGDFSDADEGTASPSSSGTSKSESGRMLFMKYYVYKSWQLLIVLYMYSAAQIYPNCAYAFYTCVFCVYAYVNTRTCSRIYAHICAYIRAYMAFCYAFP